MANPFGVAEIEFDRCNLILYSGETCTPLFQKCM